MGKSELVQPSAQSQKDLRQRESRTFARSDVVGNDIAAQKRGEGDLHHAITTRKEDKWQSNVFAGPQANRLTRKNLEPTGAGKGGLYGDRDDQMDWQKKQPIAGVIS